MKHYIWFCRGKGAAEQQADDEGFEQREHNRDVAGAGLEQRAKQQRLLLEQASTDGATPAPKRHVWRRCKLMSTVSQAIASFAVLKRPARSSHLQSHAEL